MSDERDLASPETAGHADPSWMTQLERALDRLVYVAHVASPE